MPCCPCKRELSKTCEPQVQHDTIKGHQHNNRTPSQAEVEQLKGEIEHLTAENKKLKEEKEFWHAHSYRENVVFDPETAHSRLEVSEDGKCVKDTGNVSCVSKNEKRFSTLIFILAKDGFSKGKHYWEVEVGPKKNWILGVVSESISRTERISFSPDNGCWVIKLEDGKYYWDQENYLFLKVNEKPTKIGIFLNLSDKSLVFYDVHRKIKLYTFTICDNFSGKLYPFFSTGLEMDSLPLRISPWFEEDC
ncbi:tripartite motif-containing protein 72-like isoform X2 [Eublepharis macularius]|uniref:Tripartite motif-containing protein 72-like isoform X2 n=1 Tax=Eublepharis macularius TaxID=481883 RepID=A0AA97K456_EUBMA|nr:tripartite motif-containing protein 72-like isoform X2 [Eublepharis macularius]